MKTVTAGSGFQPNHTYPEPEKMTAQDWAQMILEFLGSCKKKFQTNCSNPTPELIGNDSLKNILQYSEHSNSQQVDWGNLIFPEWLSKIESVNILAQFERTITKGRTKMLCITKNWTLFLCSVEYDDYVLTSGGMRNTYHAKKVEFTEISEKDTSLLAEMLLNYESNILVNSQKILENISFIASNSLFVKMQKHAEKTAKEFSECITGDINDRDNVYWRYKSFHV